MRTDAFDFELPEDRIALHPATPRDAARLLEVRPGDAPRLTDYLVRDLPQLLRPGDALVFNDTRVIHADLSGLRRRGEEAATAKIGVTLIKRVGSSEWLALARPAKRLQMGDRIRFGGAGEVCLLDSLDATIVARGEAGEVTLAFDFSGPDLDTAIAARGRLPLPPYIAGRRGFVAEDELDYQTVYAVREGAVAAPTAGLHFTSDLMDRLRVHGITCHFVTLHVGAGTFLPMKAADTKEHKMHPEWGEVGAETARSLNTARAAGGRIVAVGTTSLRLLESAATQAGELQPFKGETAIFITPGYRFRAVDLLMTNFHLPRSTLFMLVSAFSGLATMRGAYAHAIEAGYRFYSYGDACLLHPSPPAA